MKTISVSALKLLLPLLLFLSTGGNNSFAFNLPEVQQEQNEETLRPAHGSTWAIRENTVPESSDPSKNHFSGSVSRKECISLPDSITTSGENLSEYQRDIKKHLSSITFPTHFFL